MKTISIIGFGRFGKTLYRLIKDDFLVQIYDKGSLNSKNIELNKNSKFTKSLEEIYKADYTFFAVPISVFENVIKKHKKFFNTRNILIDVLSVKIHPKKVFTRYLKNTSIQAMLTHPMFGPDSSKEGFTNLTMIIDKFRCTDETMQFWKEYFISKKLNVVEMSAEKHDRLAADSQGLTHFIGRLLEKVHFTPTPIDSLGSKKLHEVTEQTVNDTWQLFTDLQIYNPFTKRMRLKLGKAYNRLYNQLLPNYVNSKYITYGIQGGKVSFNEEALMYFINNLYSNNLKKSLPYKIKYLYTSEKVLKSLQLGYIDYGLFAITNSTGGIVEESMNALAKYSSVIVSDFNILIRHFLMKRSDVDISEITTISAHPQVFAQCKNTLKNKFNKYKQISGKGDLIDTAKAANYLAKMKIPKSTAILGPSGLALKYNLDIIAENLQDQKDNLTRFLLVKRG